MIRLTHHQGLFYKEWEYFMESGPEPGSVLVRVDALCLDCNTPHGYVDDVLDPTVMILHHDDTCPNDRGYVIEVGEEVLTRDYFWNVFAKARSKARA